MRITIENITNPTNNQKYSLLDTWVSNEGFECPLVLAYNGTLIEENTEIENGTILLHNDPTDRDDFAIYKDADSYYEQSNSSMSEESIIPIGGFSQTKSAYCMINGKVVDVQNKDNNIYINLECNSLVFQAFIENNTDTKIEIGNIVHAVWWAELVIGE